MRSRLDHLPPRYRNAEEIGRGGMAVIFRVTDEELGREVVVKVLAERYAADPELRARFRREALAAARLSGSPHVVTIFDVTEHGGRPMIVMEYLAGGSLADRLRDGRAVPVAQALAWLDDAAAALDAAQAAGIVHRDVKPANLLLDPRGRLYVADFGVASAAGLVSFTQTGTILGTAGYLAPEQARGERATSAADRYGLAVVAWELLTGHRPFEADSPTSEAMAHVSAPVPAVSAANPELPRELDAVFVKALGKTPRERYESAAEFVGALRRALDDDADATGWDRQAAPTLPGRAALDASVPRMPDDRRRSRFRGIAALLALLAAGGVGAAVLVAEDAGGHGAGAPTVTRTVRGPVLTRTVTSPATTTRAAATGPSLQTGAQLNAAGYAQMQQRDYPAALPLLERAAQLLAGSGQIDEAYADYNLAYTLSALGQCTGVLELLDRAQAVEGRKPPIDALRGDTERRCRSGSGGPGPSPGDGRGQRRG